MSVNVHLVSKDKTNEFNDVEIYRNVVGHALVLVVKKDNGDLDVERIIGINADSAEENAIAGDFIKKVEAKLAEIFEPVPEAKLWIPA